MMPWKYGLRPSGLPALPKNAYRVEAVRCLETGKYISRKCRVMAYDVLDAMRKTLRRYERLEPGENRWQIELIEEAK